jgi:type I restriction enzyme, S subunit
MTWATTRMGEHFRVRHGYAFKGEYFDSEGPYVLLTPGSFNEEGGYRDQGEKTKFYTGDVPEGYVLDEGDLLVAMTEQTPGLLGSSAWIPEGGRLLHNQRLGRIVDLDERRLNKRFLYYLFNTKEVRDQISATATGGKVRHTAPERIAQVLFRRPPLDTQRRIAAALSAYDDLIENNQRRMALLEEAARQLHREWFVRLRFPGHEHTRITNDVPEGWEPRTLGDLCDEVRESVEPDTLEPDTPYIGLHHMPRRSISLSEWGAAEQVTSTKHRFREGEILFGKIRPYFHKVGMAFLDGVASSDAIVIRPLSTNLRGVVLLTVASDEFVAVTAQTMREGSKMPRADWKQMQQYAVPLPPDGLLSTFESAIQSIVEQLKTLTLANQKLRAGRDLLLPRLLSGEIAV